MDGDGFKCLQYREDAKDKTHQRGASMRPHVPKVVNNYPNFENIDHCLVQLYEKYVSLLPTTKKNKSLNLHAKKKPTAKFWYLDYPLCINIITPLVKELCRSVGATDGNFRNQLLQATMATRMYDQG